MKHWNKPLALLLAMAMALSMAATALADESTGNEEGIMPISEEEGAVPVSGGENKDGEKKDEADADKDADADADADDADKDADADAGKDADNAAGEVPAPVMSFTDVTAQNWFYDAVNYVTLKNLIDAKDETAFAPGENMTRQMLAVALYRLAGSPEVTAENPFTDVADDAAYKNAVVWAYSRGIVKGEDAATFNPDSPIQRQAIAVMLARCAGVDTAKEGDLSAFTDADAVQDYAKASLSWAAENGLIKGNSEGAVNPRGNATRAEVATILQRFAPMVEDVSTAGAPEPDDAAQPAGDDAPEGSAAPGESAGSAADSADADRDSAADKDNADNAPAGGEGDADADTAKKDV